MAQRYPDGTVFDGFLSLHGVDSGSTYATVLPSMAYRASNATFRHGRPRTRPGFVYRALTFDHLQSKKALETGKFQGAERYTTGTGSYLMAAVGGRLFQIEVATGYTIDHSLSIGTMSPVADRLYFVQADRYFIAQDGQNVPIIVEGTTARRAQYGQYIEDEDYQLTDDPEDGYLPVNEVPIGTVMAYGQNRLFVALPHSNKFVAGDILDPDNPVTCLRFTETEFLTGGGSIAIPKAFGDIVAMAFLPVLNSVIGQGPLIVFGQTGVQGYNFTIPRTDWQSTQIGTALLFNIGSASHRVVAVNSDLYYQALDGIRSLRQTALDLDTPDMTPVSREVDTYLRDNTPWLLHVNDCAVFDNRLLMTVAPEMVWLDGDVRDYRHKALVALDFHSTSSIGAKDAPRYEGVWTGLRPMSVTSGRFGGEARCFVFSKDTDLKNRLYELDPTLTADQGPYGERPIEVKVETRSYGFGGSDGSPGSYFNQKVLQGVEGFLSQVEGDVRLSGFYSPDAEALVYPLKSMPGLIRAQTRSDLPLAPAPQPQTRFRVNFGVPSDAYCRPGTKQKAEAGFEFRVLLKWVGHAALDRMRLRALTPSSEVLSRPCLDEETPASLTGVPDDPYEYKIVPELPL